MSEASPRSGVSNHRAGRSAGRRAWLVLHWLIIVNFLGGMAYAAYMVFWVVTPPGGGGPLFGRAAELSYEMMVTRRLYALEFWVATGGLAVYLALTEMAPRLGRYRRDR